MNKKVNLYELSEVMQEVLLGGGEVSFVCAGISMLPMLRDRQDKIYLVKPKEKLKKNDVIFYRRDNGAFVLHRIVEVNDSTYTTRGDNQHELEKGIKDSQVIAKLSAYEKNGVKIYTASFRHRLYCFFLPVIRALSMNN